MGLRKTGEWILVSDVFKGQWMDSVKQLVSYNDVKMVPVPNDMIQKFQPLDLTQITSCMEPEKVNTNLKMSILKPQH